VAWPFRLPCLIELRFGLGVEPAHAVTRHSRPSLPSPTPGRRVSTRCQRYARGNDRERVLCLPTTSRHTTAFAITFEISFRDLKDAAPHLTPQLALLRYRYKPEQQQFE
jgi:hypothetical protein